MEEAQAAEVIARAIDSGVRLIDTAPSYGQSEDLIGRALSGRRHEVVLSTKVGYAVPGVADWTPEAVVGGVDLALRRLRTDHIDVVHLHSCPLVTLQSGGVAEALSTTVEAGKVRVAAYSGENEALDWAVGCGSFAAIQTSLNLCEQRSAAAAVPRARELGLGVLGKRTLANAPWRFSQRPEAPDLATYWERWSAMALELPDPPADVALRFAVFSTGADCCLLGTGRAERLDWAVGVIEKGPLDVDLVASLRSAIDPDWLGVI